MKNVVLIDDNSDIAKSWSDHVNEINKDVQPVNVRLMEVSQFEDEIQKLEQRRVAAHKGDDFAHPLGENEFDKIDILLVDYDLMDFNKNEYITGDPQNPKTPCKI